MIDAIVHDFLTTEPPPPRIQDTQLPTLLVTKLLYSEEQPIPSDNEEEERASEPTQEVTDKDFEVFYQQEDPKDTPSPSHRYLPSA